MPPKRARPPALFVSPTLPSETGNGLAMRAGVFLEALAADHDVHLLVVPLVPGARHASTAAFAERWAARIDVLDEVSALDPLIAVLSRIEEPEARRRMLAAYPRPKLARFTHARTVADAARRFAGIDFSVVHVMRTYLADFASPWLDRPRDSGRPLCALDADECESRTHRSLAVLHGLRGEEHAAEHELDEAEKYEGIERERLAPFDRIVVASPVDAKALEACVGRADVRVVPNAVRIDRRAARADTPARAGGAFTLLFVGTLDYLPNVDGCGWFCREVLPLLRERGGDGFRVVIVGTRPGSAVRELERLDGVTVAVDVPDVASYYRAADAAVVPLRAGGGTRIKVLEAFAYGVPVVTTTIGAEGLDLSDGTHALIADHPPALADACVRLAGTPSLREALSRAARDRVLERHDVDSVRSIARAVFHEG